MSCEYMPPARHGPSVTIRDGRELQKAFWQSSEFVELLQSEFPRLSERMQYNYLKFLTPTAGEDSQPRLLTDRERAIADAAFGGSHGWKNRDAAIDLLIRIEPSPEVAQVLVKLIEAKPPEQRIPSPPHVFAAAASPATWDRQDFHRWVMLKRLGASAKAVIPTLTRWVEEERHELGAIGVSFEFSGVTLPSRSNSWSRGMLACEILAEMEREAKAAIPAIYNRIEQLCGQRPTANGRWGIVTCRNTSFIPTGYERWQLVGQRSIPDDELRNKVEELDSLVFAAQTITGSPVRFSGSRGPTGPVSVGLIHLNTIPVIDKSLAFGPQRVDPESIKLFELVTVDGLQLDELLDTALGDEDLTADEIASLGSKISDFAPGRWLMTAENPDYAQRLSAAWHGLSRRTLRISPSELEHLGETRDSDWRFQFINGVRSAFRGQHYDHIAELLDAAEDPEWVSVPNGTAGLFGVNLRSVNDRAGRRGKTFECCRW